MVEVAQHALGQTELAAPWVSNATHDLLFLEFFAGSGNLSREVARLGIPTWQPDEVSQGGTYFSVAE